MTLMHLRKGKIIKKSKSCAASSRKIRNYFVIKQHKNAYNFRISEECHINYVPIRPVITALTGEDFFCLKVAQGAMPLKNVRFT